ncbi:hypothetical protein [Ureibacillus thermophilus]|uniref:Uncharacterized protein n=1 Tax=Ureibacillus thermophilus TaxID=367743 RepID=A0A4P6UW31_9BACL|nr:hypothetical protein [Ureibacillus thermophilus]QBK26755.1 hypothetical protein DKZ56_13390 [Ureibacillus thermophilus]
MIKKIEPYELINFVDHILQIDENGNFIPVIDEKTGKQKVNPITGAPVWKALQEGTRHNAKVMGHLDKNIQLNREYLIAFQRQLKSIIAQLELNGRVPSANGNFLDAFDGSPSRIKLLNEATHVKADISAGTNVAVSVIDASQFNAFTYATIFDGTNYEDVYITAVDTSANTITVQTMAHDYVKGAIIARSTAVVDTETQEMLVGPHTVYEVELVEVV